MVSKTITSSNTHTLLVSKYVNSSLYIPEWYQIKVMSAPHWLKAQTLRAMRAWRKENSHLPRPSCSSLFTLQGAFNCRPWTFYWASNAWKTPCWIPCGTTITSFRSLLASFQSESQATSWRLLRNVESSSSCFVGPKPMGFQASLVHHEFSFVSAIPPWYLTLSMTTLHLLKPLRA